MARPSAAVVSVEVRGLDELQAAFPAWEKVTERALGIALMQVAILTTHVTAMRAPVLTGRFRGSLRAERLGDAIPTVRITEGEGLAYGRWLEYGRRKNGKAAKGRYLPPTARRQKRLVKERLKQT